MIGRDIVPLHSSHDAKHDSLFLRVPSVREAVAWKLGIRARSGIRTFLISAHAYDARVDETAVTV